MGMLSCQEEEGTRWWEDDIKVCVNPRETETLGRRLFQNLLDGRIHLMIELMNNLINFLSNLFL